MSTDVRVLLRGAMLSAALLAGCAMEVSDPAEAEGDVDVEATHEALRARPLPRPVPLPLPNPCTVTSCPTGTTCEVQDGEAVCVPRDDLQLLAP